MQNPFQGQPQQAIAPGLKQDSSLGNLAAQLLLAKKAKDSGNKFEHAAQLLKLNHSLQQQKLDDEKARFAQTQKYEAEILKRETEIAKLKNPQELMKEYLSAVNAGDKQKMLALAGVMQHANPELIKWFMAQGDDYLKSVLAGADETIQQQEWAKKNRPDIDALTEEQVTRQKDIFGQELSPFQRALQARRGGANTDPSAAANIDTGQQPDANTQAQIESDESIASEKSIPKEQHLAEFMRKNGHLFGFTEEEIKEGAERILSGESEITPLDFIDAVDNFQKPEGMSDADFLKWKNEKKAEILGASDPAKSATRATNLAEFERMVRKYPARGAMNKALHAMNLAFGPTQAHQLAVILDNIADGISWQNQTEEGKDNIAGTMKRQIDSDPPGGESGRRVLEARNEFLVQLPAIIELMKEYESKTDENGKPRKLGNALRLTDAEVRLATTRSKDPDLDKIRTALQDMTSNILLFKSGAAVTEQEFQRQLDISPAYGIGFEFSLARTEGLLESARRGMKRFYTDSIGDEIGERIVEKYIDPKVQSINQERQERDEIGKLSDEDRKILNSLTPQEQAIFDDLRANKDTVQDALDFIKGKRNAN